MTAIDPHSGLPEQESVRARPWPHDRPPERVLAIRLHALGDTVITLPYLRALARRYPATRLDFLTRGEVAGVPRSVELFDRVYAIGGGRSTIEQWIWVLLLTPWLRTRRYQMVLDLQRSRMSRFVRRCLAPEAWSEFDRFSAPHAGERTRATIEAVGLGDLDVRADLVLREPSAGRTKLMDAGWDGSSPIVVLNPGGAFEGRHWPIESYARFAELWLKHQSPTTQFLVLGLANIAEKAGRLRERLGRRCLDLTGKTSVEEAFALVGQARLVLSEDSGLMHMAWVSGVPTLALFGASRGGWARPLGEYTDWIKACRREDGACIRGECLAGSPSCLVRLEPEVVFERARDLVDASAHASETIYADGRLHAPPLDA